MSIPQTSDYRTDPPSPRYYTPGARLRKLLMIILGLTIFVLSAGDLWPALRLVFFGTRATAEATRVIKSRPGSPDQIITDTAALTAATENEDRSYSFSNEFQFQTSDGHVVMARPSTSGLAKPLFPLIDEEGLPTETIVYYDAGHPEAAIFPNTMSTWFAPCVFAFLGLLCALIGSFLFYWADKPIELPHLPTESEIKRLH